MVRIACLHTADSNIAVFEAALGELGRADVTLSHVVRSELLASAEAAGGLTEAIVQRTCAVLQGLAEGADVVLLTCSTLGPAVERAAAVMAAPVLRVDGALAAAAGRGGGKIVVLCAVRTTLGPTKHLFEAACAGGRADIDVRLVAGAWDAFQAGDGEGYLDLIARAAEAALASGADQVVLAQASMAGAAKRIAAGGLVRTSPLAGLVAAVEASAANARRDLAH